MPADVAGPMEVHEYRSDSEHSDADEDLKADPGPSKQEDGESKLGGMWGY